MVRTRSSRRLEEHADTEQLPALEKVSTRRRGKKQTITETVVDAEKTLESAAEQAACLPHVHTNISQEPRIAGMAIATDHKSVNGSIDGNSEQAAAIPDVAQQSPARDGGDIDFSIEAVQLAKAILHATEDEQQTSGSPAPTNEQHQHNSEFAPAQQKGESPPVPDDANRKDHTIGARADTVLQEEHGIPSTSAHAISATAPHGGAPDESPASQQRETSSDDRQADEDLHIVRTKRLGISEGLEPGGGQPASNACPHTGQDPAEDNIADDLASGRPKPVVRDAKAGSLLQKRSSMRSGSLEAYERGAAPTISHCTIAFASNQGKMSSLLPCI